MSGTAGDMVQIHMLTAYPASLLNRDDTGLAKRVPFGDATRTRISSQCLKKHWREADLLTELGPMAVRSTRVYERLVALPLIAEHGASEEEAVAIAKWLMSKTVDTKPARATEGVASAQSGQLLVLTRAETEYLLERAAEVLRSLRDSGISVASAADVEKHQRAIDIKSAKDILKGLPASLDTALFGRMVTSDLFARVDSAVSVAHAFTTHREAAETDYFTAIDTLMDDTDHAGAGLIQDTELTTGVYYLYAVIDMNQLRDNLVGFDAAHAERLARNLIEAMATVSPGAKRGSTAPYAYAEFVLTERGQTQPRSLANAFLKPIEASGANVMAASVDALLGHRVKLEAMYGESALTAAMATIHEPRSAGPEQASFTQLLDRTFPTAA